MDQTENSCDFTFSLYPEPLPSKETCLSSFDLDKDGCLNLSEFSSLCAALFVDGDNTPYETEGEKLQDMFDTFDTNQDGKIDENEFELCWENWIKTILRPVSAFVVIDVQNDFISGSLSISTCPANQNGEEIIEPINQLLDTVDFDAVFYAKDWHPENHISFADNISLRKVDESSDVDSGNAKVFDTVIFEGPPKMVQKLWPRHCVQDSWGSELHQDLKILDGSTFIYKGTNPDVDSYSALFDNFKLSKTALESELFERNVTDVYVCGLAYDICVGTTAIHALELDYRVILIDDACRGASLEDIEATKQKIHELNGLVMPSTEVNAMVQGKNRRPELGYKLALRIKGAN